MSNPGLSIALSPNQVPSYQDLSSFNVNRDGWEVIRQTMYDANNYPAAGIQVLNFFQLPVGQGVGIGGGNKTLSDTNMVSQGMMPQNQEFLVQSVEVQFLPTTPTVTAQMPAAFGAQAAALIVNDAYIFYRSGNLVFTIGSKPYLQEAPMMKFPPKQYFELHGALSDVTTAGATLQNRLAFGTARGRPYLMNGANLRLVSNQNFVVTLAWPEGLTLISNPARVFVVLDGLLYRRSQ